MNTPNRISFTEGQSSSVKVIALKAEAAAIRAEKKEEDLLAELDALRYYRRHKLIDARAFKTEKNKLISKQQSASDAHFDALDKILSGVNLM